MLFGTICFAQDRPLGDVARETREKTAQAPKPAKMLANEDADGRSVTADDDPLDVVTKAATALLHDTSHRCRQLSSGNSGPGWSIDTTMEIAGPDRLRMDQLDEGRRGETILVGNEGYRRMADGPWTKIDPREMTWYQSHLDAIKLPDELKFGYKSGDLKLVGPEAVNGSLAFHYRYKVHDTAIDRSIDIWVGSKDNLPRRTEMTTHNLEIGTSWHQTTDCTFGVQAKIEPPF